MAEVTNEERLFKVFSNVNDWLKFAEAKNAMILAFNAASIYGAVKFFDMNFVKESPFLQCFFLFSIIQLVFSAICALVSFAPRVKIIPGGLFSGNVTPNVLFFEYLKTKTNLEIIKEINLVEDPSKCSSYEQHLATQIQQNSIIASRKYSYFTISVWLTISAYITFPLALIFALYTYIKK